MLNFPHYSYTLLVLLLFIVFGFLGTSYSIYFWFYEDKSEVTPSETFKMIMTVCISPIFLLSGLSLSTYFIYQAYIYRNIQIADVSAFSIVTTESEFKPDGKHRVILNDQITIQKMLISIKECEEFAPNHESFENGYKITFVFNDGEYSDDFYLSVYKTSTAKNGKTSVTGNFLGNYNCPVFQDLVKAHIDPLFQNSGTLSK